MLTTVVGLGCYLIAISGLGWVVVMKGDGGVWSCSRSADARLDRVICRSDIGFWYGLYFAQIRSYEDGVDLSRHISYCISRHCK